MEVLLTLLIIIASVLLVAVVLIQNPKGGGLSSNFGAPSQLGGVQRANDFVEKATWTLAGAIAVLTLVMVMMNSGPQAPAPQQDAAGAQPMEAQQ
jgi:preprotein translocase subunit SecG